ncbi:MAG: phosphoenolpyruvate--protein phosphotransferase [Gemmatales bacterium]|nr:phosphoenolpyruvate--protein phosphotransferase [Gemmatales bacterium]MCS7161167.1 phosphoenolpyruvate--protein phosphotransferase [Gemmatales bacterium]MDW8176370.1 phosphoenolpyruvate--protein phosphotransferase [Gemmatales bacterium]MDW8221686.1 phosphoenolpyruvate--protein phosphotransferase [Gemmatales bacterium]
MEIKRGVAVSPGVAIGPAWVLDTEEVRIGERFIAPGTYPEEIERFDRAVRSAAGEARQVQKTVSERLGEQYGAIFGAHAALIEDPSLRQEVAAQIRDQGFTAEYALSRVIRRRAKLLAGLNDRILADRQSDLFDIEKRLLRQLVGQRQQQLQKLSQPTILLAHDLTPSETAQLDRRQVLAFATEAGGRTSHTAIVANALGIPAVVGLGPFLTDVSGGDLVIVDGNRGVLILDPDAETLEHYRQAQQAQAGHERELVELRDLPAVTRDGVRIFLLGNIEFPEEAAQILERGADGVGLYRTEFLYLGRKEDPTEQEHFQAYLQVLRQLPSKPIVIRTLDIGADKFSSVTEPLAQERNPFLGVRSLRLCLHNKNLFRVQLRAILRASAYGDIRIMFPMVSTLAELREAKLLLYDVMEELSEEQVPFNQRIPVGTMIEVPSAALMADQLAREVDFFSIGTNDLIQYVLAADRTNENVAYLYNASDPAVLRLIDQVVRAAERARIPVNVCGEMSAEPMYAYFLVGIGLRQLSASPHAIPEIKRLVRSITAEDARRAAQAVLQMETAQDITSYLRDQLRRILPEALAV